MLYILTLMCSSHGRSLEIPGGWGVLKERWGLTGISGGVGGFKPKSLPWEGYGYFLEQHNLFRISLNALYNTARLQVIVLG